MRSCPPRTPPRALPSPTTQTHKTMSNHNTIRQTTPTYPPHRTYRPHPPFDCARHASLAKNVVNPLKTTQLTGNQRSHGGKMAGRCRETPGKMPGNSRADGGKQPRIPATQPNRLTPPTSSTQFASVHPPFPLLPPIFLFSFFCVHSLFHLPFHLLPNAQPIPTPTSFHVTLLPFHIIF